MDKCPTGTGYKVSTVPPPIFRKNLKPPVVLPLSLCDPADRHPLWTQSVEGVWAAAGLDVTDRRLTVISRSP